MGQIDQFPQRLFFKKGEGACKGMSKYIAFRHVIDTHLPRISDRPHACPYYITPVREILDLDKIEKSLRLEDVCQVAFTHDLTSISHLNCIESIWRGE